MKNAKELLLEYTDLSFREPLRAAAMFTEDGALEIPYLADFGWAPRYAGNHDLVEFFQLVRGLYPGFKFENVQVHIETPERVFAEYEFAAVSSKTGRSIRQHFFGWLVAEGGGIKLLREALNSVALAKAVYAQGIPELPTQS